MDTTAQPFTMDDALAVAAILSAAQRCARVVRMLPDRDIIVRATATHVAMADGGIVMPTADIRSTYLMVSLDSGRTEAWPVAELIRQHKEFTFVTE